jgi:uncharacterized protein YfaS (alpha-2-macroglobulin family)
MSIRFPVTSISWFALLIGLLSSVPPGLAEEPPGGTFTIERISADAESRSVKVTFNTKVNFENLSRNLRVIPPADIYWWNSSLSNPQELSLQGDFQYGTSYLIALPEDFQSESGQAYRKSLNTFLMPNLKPVLEFAARQTLIERDSRQMVHLDLVNVSEVLCEGVKVPPLLLPAAQKIEGRTAETALRDAVADLQEKQETWSKLADLPPELQPFLGPVQYQSHLFFSLAKPNVKTAYSVPLNFREGKEKGGLDLLSFRNNKKGESGQTPIRLYRITDLSLSVKQTHAGLLIWVTSLRSGKPAAGVSLLAFDRQGQAFSLGKTDEAGILQVRDQVGCVSLYPDGPPVIETKPLPLRGLSALAAATANDAAWISLAKAAPLDVADIPQSATTVGLAQPVNASLFTERGVYRPSETVYFKAVVREMLKGDIAPPKAATCEIEIEDSKEETVYSAVLDYSEFGSAFDAHPLPAYAPLGVYTLRLKHAGSAAALASSTFQVQEFRPPRHSAQVRFRQETRRNDSFVNLEREEQVLVCTLGGRYYAGGPVKHGQVRWKIFSSATDFTFPDHPGFTFGSPGGESPEFIDSGESILDESGEVEVSIPLGQEVLAGKHGLEVTATVVDFDGRTATESGKFQVRPDFLVGLSAQSSSAEVGDPLSLRILALDPTRQPVEEGMVEVRVMERSWYYTRKRNEDGNAYWSWSEVWRSQSTSTLPIKDGAGLFDFEFNQSGSFLVECTYRSPDGKESTSGITYHVSGPYGWYEDVEGEGKPRFEKVRLLTDKSEYAIGDTIRLSIKSKTPLASCLYTLEREGVLEHRLVSIQDGQIEIPVTDAFRPNVYLSVLGTVGRGEFPSYSGEFDTGAPKFVFGAIKVPVRTTTEPLSISIAPGIEKIKALPGEELPIQISAADPAGNGVEAEIFVAVVDEQVLALTRYQTPDLKRLLDFTIPLSVFTKESRLDLQNQTPYEEFRNEPLTGGGGGLAGEGMGIQIREDFNPVAFVEQGLRTDTAGKASVVVKFPDTMTTYRVFVVACDKRARVATSQRAALVVRDFYLEPGIPRFLNRGDEFRFQVAAFNKTGQGAPASIEVDSSPQVSLETESQSYPVNPFDRTLIPVKGKALRAGDATLTLTGRFKDLTDAVRVNLPVRTGLLVHRDLLFEKFKGRAEVDYKFPFDTSQLPVEDLGPKDLSFILSLSGSPFARLAPGLRYLLDYPYGCVEQTSSRTLALAALRSGVQEGLIPGIETGETDKYLQKGIERLLTMQTGSGAFAYWPGQYKPHPWGTIYALSALLMAQEAELEIDEGRLGQALNYLAGEMANSAEGSLGASKTGRPFAAWLLAQADRLPEGQFRPVWNDFGKLSRQGQLLALLAAHEAGLVPERELREKATKTLADSRGETDTEDFHAVMREPALELMVANTLVPGGSTTQRLAGGLLAAMKPEGCWTSTSDTGWVLAALGDYFAGSEFLKEPVEGEVLQAGVPEQAFRVEEGQSEFIALDPAAFLAHPHVEIVTQGKAWLSYQLTVTCPRMDASKSGSQDRFRVHKSFENTAGTEKVHVGDVLKVKVVVEVQDKNGRYLVLDDPLPAGLVAVNSALASEEPIEGFKAGSEDSYYRYWDSEGFYRLVPSFYELRDDRVLVFRDDLWKGQYQYTYYARAVCAGKFRMPSTKVQWMYDPEQCAYSPESEMVIEER